MDCKECNKHTGFSSDMAFAMAERTIKRLWITILLLIVLFAGSNLAWIVYESQFEVVEESTTTTNTKYEVDQETDGGGDNSFVHVGGDYYGFETESKGDN